MCICADLGVKESRSLPAAPLQAPPTAAGPDQRQTPVEMILSVLGDERDDGDVINPTGRDGQVSDTASPKVSSDVLRGGAQTHIGRRITDTSPRLSSRSAGHGFLSASVHHQVVRRSLDTRQSPRISRMSQFSSAAPDGRSSSRPKLQFSPSPNLILLKMLVQPSDKVRKT